MLSEVVLESIVKLRECEHGRVPDDIMKLVPVPVITSFLDRGGFSAAILDFFPINGVDVGKRVIKRKAFSDEGLCFCGDLRLTGSYFVSHGVEASLGSIRLYSDRVVGDDEVKALLIFSRFVADYLEKKISDVIHNRIKRSEVVIGDYFRLFSSDMKGRDDGLALYWGDDQVELNLTYERSREVEDRPGTVAHKMVTRIYQSLKPFCVAYCSYYKGDFVVEYKAQRRNRNRLPFVFERRYRASDELSSSLSGDCSVVEKLYDECDGGNEYVVSPVRDRGAVVGFFFFEFRDAHFLYLKYIKELLLYSSRKFGRLAGFLFQRRYKELIVDPIFGSRETRVKERKAFVLMPFSESWSGRVWEHYIKPTVEGAGMDVVRADDLFGQNIVEDIWSSILDARIIIADITNRNTNVFYELGIAHTLGKDVIILTQSEDDIPFDIRTHRCIVYADNHDGYEKLKLELFSHIKNRLGVS